MMKNGQPYAKLTLGLDIRPYGIMPMYVEL